MLTLDNIHMQQGGFSLSADITIPGKITALLGPSGAGKSTVLNLIAGFAAPKAGRVLFGPQDITPLPPMQRPVSILFQDNNLFPHLTAGQNLALALTHKKPDAAQMELIDSALAQVGLAGVQGRLPATLSGGQQSRVALARVLLQQRAVLLLDEPFAALGPALKNEMLDLVADIQAANDLQVLMVSHDPRDAARIADMAAVVADGTVTAPVAVDALLADPPPTLRAYLGR